MFNSKSYFIIIALLGSLAIIFDFISFDLGFYLAKPSTTLLIIVLTLRHRSVELKGYSKKILVGLTFCLAGDLFLLFNSYFLYGLGAFLIAHFCFLFAFVKQQGFKWPLKPGLLLFSFAATLICLCYPKLESLLFPVLIYIGVILLMSWQGIALQQSKKHLNFQFLGWAVGIFLFSDALIALNKFYAPFQFSGIMILSTYWMAISLISISAMQGK